MRAIMFLTMTLMACATSSSTESVPGAIAGQGEVVMTVNDTLPITQPMVDAVTARVPPAQLERMNETGQIDQFYQQIAVGEVLYQRALEEGVLNDEIVRIGSAMAVRQYLAGYMVQRAGEADVSDEALQAMYEERSIQYQKSQAHASHILVKEFDKANELLEKITAGEDFATLAIEHSTDPGSGKKGGDLGWFEAGRMVKEFSDATFAANAGDVVGPVETRFGFHIIKVHDKRDMTPLADVRDQLKETIQRTSQESYLEEVQNALTIVHANEKSAGGSKDGTGGRAGPGEGDGSGKGDGTGKGDKQ